MYNNLPFHIRLIWFATLEAGLKWRKFSCKLSQQQKICFCNDIDSICLSVGNVVNNCWSEKKIDKEQNIFQTFFVHINWGCRSFWRAVHWFTIGIQTYQKIFSLMSSTFNFVAAVCVFFFHITLLKVHDLCQLGHSVGYTSLFPRLATRCTSSPERRNARVLI